MTAEPARPSLFARALRGGALTAGSYAFTQALRLASNLILTRLLFPEAFGLMALVSVVLVGLAMFSDVGIGPAAIGCGGAGCACGGAPSAGGGVAEAG